MFDKLKEKLQDALKVFSRKTEEEAVEKVIPPAAEEKKKESLPEKKQHTAPEKKREEKKESLPKESIPSEVTEKIKVKSFIPEKKKEVVHQIQQEPQEKKAQRKEKINGIKITYFVHGTTTDNEQGLCTGWNQGELSELGKKQSKELLNLIGDVQFDVIFCSDLKRAVDSARLTFVHDPYKIIHDKLLS